MTSIVADVRLDGRSTGEYGLNAAVAGHFGLPVALVTGDERAVAQVHDLLGTDAGYRRWAVTPLPAKRCVPGVGSSLAGS